MNTKCNIMKTQMPIIFAISLIIFILFSSCNNPSENHSSTIGGLLNLVDDENGSEYPGIDAIIALYPEAKIDERYLNIRAQYGFVGKELSSRDCFDHRKLTPIASVSTDGSGNYEFTDIPYGTYNLVAVKEGWGPRYIYNIVVNSKSITINPISLRELVNVTHDLEEFEADRTYIVQHDVTLTSQEVILHRGFSLYICPDVSIVIPAICSFNNSGEGISRISSSENLNRIGEPIPVVKYHQVYFSSKSPQQSLSFEDIIVSYGTIGIRAHAGCINIENSFFSENTSGIIVTSNFEQGWDAESIVSHNVFIGDNEGDAVHYQGPIAGEIANNIVLDFSTGIHIKDKITASTSNNIISYNSVGIKSYHLEGVVSNNLLVDNRDYDMMYIFNLGIDNIQGTIMKNMFFSQKGVYFGPSNDYVSLNVLMENNNFFNDQYFYETRIPDSESLWPYMNCLNRDNYFGLANIEQIESKVLHHTSFEFSSDLFRPQSISIYENSNCGPLLDDD